MRLTHDLDRNIIIAGLLANTPVKRVDFTAGSVFDLEHVFVRPLLAAEALATPLTLIVGIKSALDFEGDHLVSNYDGASYVHTTAGSGASTVYSTPLDFTGTDLYTLLDAAAVLEVDFVDVVLEVKAVAGEEVLYFLRVPCRIFNNYNRGVEGAVDPNPAGYQPLSSTLSSLATLTDPGGDRIVFWDDSAGAFAFLTAGTGLEISATTMTAEGGGGGGGGASLSIANRTTTTLDIASDSGTDATVPAATTSLAGLLTSADKTKLDGLASTYQPLDTQLTELASLVDTKGQIPVFDGTNWTTIGVPGSDNTVLTRSSGSASGWALSSVSTLLGTVAVTSGGTGRTTSTTAYGLLAAGTSATGAHQTLAAGATTEILVGGGPVALPVWTTATGSGAPVRATSPTLVTPALGTPSALVLTNATGLPLTSGVTGILPHGNLGTGGGGSTKFLREDSTYQTISGGGDALVANPLSQFAATTSAQLRGVLSDENGTGVALFDGATGPSFTSPVIDTSALFASGTVLSWDAGEVTLTHSANTLTLAGGDLVVSSDPYDAVAWNGDSRVPTKNDIRDKIEALPSETQTLSNKTLTAPVLGTPTSGTLTNCTGLPVASGISGLGTGVATALAVNVGSAGAFVTLNGALGTPSSGVLSSCTGVNEPLVILLSGPEVSTAATTGRKAWWRVVRAFTLAAADVSLDVVTAPTSASFIGDIEKNGSSIYSTRPSIDATEISSATGVAGTMSSDPTSFAIGDIVGIWVDQIGSGTAGAGASMTLNIKS